MACGTLGGEETQIGKTLVGERSISESDPTPISHMAFGCHSNHLARSIASNTDTIRIGLRCSVFEAAGRAAAFGLLFQPSEKGSD
jgi:hypothetical protein